MVCLTWYLWWSQDVDMCSQLWDLYSRMYRKWNKKINKSVNSRQNTVKSILWMKTTHDVEVKHIYHQISKKEIGLWAESSSGPTVFKSASEGGNMWEFQLSYSVSLIDPITRPPVYTLTDPNRLQISFLRTSPARGGGALKPNWLYWSELWRYWYHA